MKKIVLDTNAYSRLMEGDEQVKEALNAADQVFLPIFVVAELLLGFRNGNKEEWNRDILKRFESIETVERSYPTDETIEIFSELLLSLKNAGKPVPVHDIWIAAMAIETGSVVVTYDNHFLYMNKARVWHKLK